MSRGTPSPLPDPVVCYPFILLGLAKCTLQLIHIRIFTCNRLLPQDLRLRGTARKEKARSTGDRAFSIPISILSVSA